MTMNSGSSAKLAALKQELRPLKYPWNALEESKILGGDCRGFFPIFRALIHAYWPSVGSRFVDIYNKQDMIGLAAEVQASDPRISIALVLGDLERADVIAHNLYKFAREVLRMDIRLKESQFVSLGYQRSKIDFMIDFTQSIKKFHQAESNQAKRVHVVAGATPRVGRAPAQTTSPPGRVPNKYSESWERIAEEVYPRPIPPCVQARFLQNFSCTERDHMVPADDSAEISTSVWLPSDVPSFKSQEEDVLTNRNRVISDDFSYLHDVYGNLETNWLDAMPLTLQDESETTWLTNPNENLVCSIMPCAADREYGMPMENPLYSDTYQERRSHNKSLCDSRQITCQNQDQDLNSLLESLEIHMDQASNILQHSYS